MWETLDRYLRAAFFWFWIGVGILLAYHSFGSFGSGLGALYIGMIFVFFGLRRLYRKNKAANVHLKDVAYVTFAIGIFVVALIGLGSFSQKHEDNFAPLLAALEQYKDTTGQYPDELPELLPEYITNLPECPVTGGWAGDSYYYKRKKGQRAEGTFIIQCAVGAFVFPQFAMIESGDDAWIYAD
jgi:hypothetical protein